MKSLEIKKDIYWVGAQDFNLRVFDIIMYTPFGTTYNSYVVKGSQKTAIFETVKEKFFPEYLERLQSLDIDISSIDYIVVDHTEPDHAGSVAKLLELAPKAKVVGSAMAIQFLKAIANRSFEAITVKDGDTLSLGDKTLKFINAPFLHWPDSIYTYVEEDKLLLTCDSFGSHYCFEEMYNDLIPNIEDYNTALRYYYDMIISPFKPHLLRAYDKIKNLDIEIICPGHGPILRQDPWKIVELYRQWSEPLEKNPEPKIVIPYVSAYGYTESMAMKIAEGLKEVHPFEIHLYDIIKEKKEDILGDMLNADGIIFGSPTINSDALLPVMDLLISLSPIVHGDKLCSAFGSYGWSGEAVDNIINRLKELRMKLIPGLKINFKPSYEELKQCVSFGKGFGEELLLKLNKSSEKADKKPKKKWKCIVCGLILEGEVPPEVCPACGAGSDQFVEVSEEIISFHSDKKEKFIIIGNGAAGFYAADAIRKRNSAADIEIISSESELTYYKPQLSDYLSSEIPERDFYLVNKNWYSENNITLTLGVVVKELKPENKLLVLNNGMEISYDKLILANGSSAFVPPIKGAEHKNVFVLRTFEDATKIKTALEESKSAVIIGGGVLGLEAAWEMKKLGIKVSVVELAPRLLPMQLDDEGSSLAKPFIDSCGVDIYLNEAVEEILGEDSVSGVRLKSGKVLQGDMVLLSVGIRPNKALAENAGIAVNRGIIVNKKMETNIPNIYACGDVAEYNGRVFGNWPAATEMGKVAGAAAVGDEKEFADFVSSIMFNALNINLFSAGDVCAKDESFEELGYKTAGKLQYKKLFLKNRRLVGGILLGSTNDSVKVVNNIEKQASKEEVIKTHLM